MVAETSYLKKDAILATGKELFWKFGFSRVTVEEICREAGVSKMTYYKYFSNKKELVIAIMDGLMGQSIAKYRDIAESELPYPEKVRQYLQLKRDAVNHMSNEYYLEYVHSSDPELTERWSRYANETFRIFTEDFSRAQKQGDIRKDIKIEFVLYIMNHMIDLSQVDQLLQLYDEPEDLVMEIVNFLFYGILNREMQT